MEIKDIEEVMNELKGITLIQMRNPKFNAKMTSLYVLVGDLVTMVRRPKNTFDFVSSNEKAKVSARVKK